MEPMGEEKEFLELLGNRVREYRKALELSQERLAELAGVHPTYISNIETAKVNATIGVYKRLADALQVSLPTLVDVNSGKVEKNELARLVLEIKCLKKREQNMVVETVKGLLAGMKR